MRFVFGEEVTLWTARQLKLKAFDGPLAQSIGVSGQNGLIAGIVYHDYRPEHETIQVSMAAVNPMWCRMLAGLLHYPFEQLGVFKLWAAVEATNGHALKTFNHIGFHQDGILEHQFGQTRHVVILGLLRPDYDRLYGVRHEQGQIVRPVAA